MQSDNSHNLQNIADEATPASSIDQWELAFDAIPDHLALISPDLKFSRVNLALARALGKRPKDLIGEPCYKHICQTQDPDESSCPHQRTMKDGRSHSVELHMEHLGGDYLVTTSALRDGTGKICGSLHLCRDITESKRSADALRQSETRFRSLVEQSLAGIYIIRDGQFLYVNPKLAEIFGYASPDEIVFGKRTMDLIAPESRDLVAENDRKRLEGKEKSVHYTFKGLRKDGTVIDVEAYGSATEIDGKPAIIGTLLDITEKLRLEHRQHDLEERLHQQQRQQSIATLAGGIAHDFNNMLMGVLGSAELLKGKLPADSKDREFVTTIIDTSRRMAGLTRQLMDYAHQGTYEHRELALGDLIHDTLALVRRSLPQGVEVQCDLAAGLWSIMADRGQMGQVLQNIIMNAVESMAKSGGRISVRAENVPAKPAWDCPLSQHPAGDYVHVKVTDTGPGIPREMQKKIFEPFFTTKFMGRGLGLASALGVVQHHAGCLSVQSEPGKGSAFHIYLPRKAAAAKAACDALGLVLVVDDEPPILALLTNMLNELGYEALVAGNGADALRLFAERGNEVKLAILDVQLSGPGGADLFRDLRSRTPGLKVLVSSGYDESTALASFGTDRPDGFIQKPYWIDSLRDKVEEVLGKGNGKGP